CFRKEGFLFNEFERIFSDLFSSRSAIYKKIVERLAEGPCELKDIYTALNVEKSGVTSIYMEDLVTAGFVSQDFTWHIKTGKDSKLSHYRLKDNYLRFYLKYIEPNKNKIARQGLKLLPQWQSAIGFQFENLVLNNRKGIQQILNIDPSEIVNDNPFFQRKAKDRSGCQIDYMIQTKFSTCYLCEIKFSTQELSKSVIDEVKQKMRSLILPKNISIRPVLIHVNGVDESLQESDFFSSIIDFKQLLEKR
ncbi:MAG: ATPase, partial [Chlamydiae bacterium]|nr:ATPase [Chlamydiota bacterium]